MEGMLSTTRTIADFLLLEFQGFHDIKVYDDLEREVLSSVKRF